MTAWQRLGAHLEACRPDSIFYVGLVSVSGVLLSARQHSGVMLLGAWAAPTFGWLASLYGGDYFDRRLDASAKPHRPIPSGRMTEREAVTGMGGCIAAGLVISVLLNPLNLALVCAAGVLGVAYSKTFKARGVLGNLARGGPTALAFLLGVLSGSGRLAPELLPIGLVFWLHDSGSNLVGALCDTAEDRRGGYRTFPVRHGDSATLRVVSLLTAAWCALAAGYAAVLASRPGPHFRAFGGLPFRSLLAVAGVLGVLALVILIRAPRPVPRLSGLRAHEVLVLERLVLASAFVAAGSGVRLTMALLLPSAAVTLVARSLMRPKYEPGRPRGLVVARAAMLPGPPGRPL